MHIYDKHKFNFYVSNTINITEAAVLAGYWSMQTGMARTTMPHHINEQWALSSVTPNVVNNPPTTGIMYQQ
jgi:hypothetical protein